MTRVKLIVVTEKAMQHIHVYRFMCDQYLGDNHGVHHKCSLNGHFFRIVHIKFVFIMILHGIAITTPIQTNVL